MPGVPGGVVGGRGERPVRVSPPPPGLAFQADAVADGAVRAVDFRAERDERRVTGVGARRWRSAAEQRRDD